MNFCWTNKNISKTLVVVSFSLLIITHYCSWPKGILGSGFAWYACGTGTRNKYLGSLDGFQGDGFITFKCQACFREG